MIKSHRIRDQSAANGNHVVVREKWVFNNQLNIHDISVKLASSIETMGDHNNFLATKIIIKKFFVQRPLCTCFKTLGNQLGIPSNHWLHHVRYERQLFSMTSHVKPHMMIKYAVKKLEQNLKVHRSRYSLRHFTH